MHRDALSHVPAEVQTWVHRIANFQLVDHTERLQVVLKSSVLAHQQVQFLLPGMAEWRMPHVVRQTNRFHEIAVQPERRRTASRNLRHLKRVRQAGAGQIPLHDNAYLRFVLRAPARKRAVIRWDVTNAPGSSSSACLTNRVSSRCADGRPRRLAPHCCEAPRSTVRGCVRWRGGWKNWRATAGAIVDIQATRWSSDPPNPSTSPQPPRTYDAGWARRRWNAFRCARAPRR